jgi:Tfp pilus assembly protein PilX
MQRERRREQGMVMFITILLLAMMGGLGLAALDSAAHDRDTAGYYNRETAAFYAADAGVQHARAVVKTITSPTDTPAFPKQNAPQKLGDTSLYSKYTAADGTVGQPSYYGDPAFANAIHSDGDSAGQYSEGMNLQSKGAKAVATLWQINVVGQGSDGQTARLEAKEVRFLFGGGY